MPYLFIKTHVPYSQKHFIKFLPFQKNVIIFLCRASIEKRKTVLTSNNMLKYQNQILLYSDTDMCISHKSISLSFQKNMIISQSRASTEERNTVLTSHFDISQITAYLFRETHWPFSQKHFGKFTHFQRM